MARPFSLLENWIVSAITCLLFIYLTLSLPVFFSFYYTLNFYIFITFNYIRGLQSSFHLINFILEIWISILVSKNNSRCFFCISYSLSRGFSLIWELLYKTLIIEIFLFLSSFSQRSNTFTNFTFKVMFSSISRRTWGNTRDKFTLAFDNVNKWNTSCMFAKCRGKANQYATGPILFTLLKALCILVLIFPSYQILACVSRVEPSNKHDPPLQTLEVSFKH